MERLLKRRFEVPGVDAPRPDLKLDAKGSAAAAQFLQLPPRQRGDGHIVADLDQPEAPAADLLQQFKYDFFRGNAQLRLLDCPPRIGEAARPSRIRALSFLKWRRPPRSFPFRCQPAQVHLQTRGSPRSFSESP